MRISNLEKITPLYRTNFTNLGAKYEGKVRDNYSVGNGERIVISTDRVSAFDRVLGSVPLKGQILNLLTAWWFGVTDHVVPNHVISIVDPSAIRCIDCTPLMCEFVVRAYITGNTSTSMWTHYENGAREFCGYKMPDGIRKNSKLPVPILTPSTKAPKGQHDISGARSDILNTGLITAHDFDVAAQMALALFDYSQKIVNAAGLILVDTKYEFGRTPDGKIVVIDEINTPDSSRYWIANTYHDAYSKGLDPNSLDKDTIRRYIAGLGYKGDGIPPEIPFSVKVETLNKYVAAYECITMKKFIANVEDPITRLQKNLSC
jgi:phosphoribosylaminoimidazole-succinocarboxamide synthase